MPVSGALDIRTLQGDTDDDWDSFARSRPDGTFFHLSGWKPVVEQSFGHRCHYLYAVRDQRIVGILPLVHIRSRVFSNALISNAFCVYGGPLAADQESADALDLAAEDLGRSLGVEYVEYRMMRASGRDWPANRSLYVTFRKEILPDEEANLLAIPRKQRAMVRKGIKGGLVTEADTNVDRFYRIYAESVRNHGTPVYGKRFYRTLKEVFADSCEIDVVTKNGEPLSAVMSFAFRDEILPYYGGGSPLAREALAAFDFMYWQVMKRVLRAWAQGVRFRAQQARDRLLCLQAPLGLRADALVLRVPPPGGGTDTRDQSAQPEVPSGNLPLEALALGGCQHHRTDRLAGPGVTADGRWRPSRR